MDVLSELLRSFHLRARVFLYSRFAGSWAVDTSGQDKATFHLVAQGMCWLHLPDSPDPVDLQGGDLVVFPRDAPHVIAARPQPPGPDVPLNQPASDDEPGPGTTLICGYFEFDKRAWNPLIEALPGVVVARAEDSATAGLMDLLIRFLLVEAESSQPGSDVVLDRLCDALFIHVVRTCMLGGEGDTGYLSALADPRVGRAMTAMHAHPAKSWTVESLAGEAGMSRSAFSVHFLERVGFSPIQYLTRWRMQLARDLLGDARLSTATVAERSGYTSEAAFSKAFKREFGVGPGSVRRGTAPA
ncbi:MAG: AraC family transcriptional regulator [Pseudomonadota bacterium]